MAQTKEELKAQLGEADVVRLFASAQADEISILKSKLQRLTDFNTQLISALRRTLSDLKEINRAELYNAGDVITYRSRICVVIDKLDQFPSPEDVKSTDNAINPEEHAAQQAVYKLTLAQRDNAWLECRQLREENDTLRVNTSLRETLAASVVHLSQKQEAALKTITELTQANATLTASLTDTIQHRDELQIQFNKTVDERDAAYVEIDQLKATKAFPDAPSTDSNIEELKAKLRLTEGVRDYFKQDSQELLAKYTDSKKLVAATQKWLHACAEKLEQQLEYMRQINDLKAQLDVAQRTSEGRRKVLFEKSEELRQLWIRVERAEEAARLNAEENARLKCEMYGGKGTLLKKFSELVERTDLDHLQWLYRTSAGFTFNVVDIAVELRKLTKKEKESNGSSEEAQSQG